ncbi:hypothetical protein K502DRAFT_329155 [Neoconidiobolus thromboides FSU 785]|nr:hypothetical protein K502DRAFT_329155 [Neoconidiobolus thromboides FSU 785]
MNSKLLLALFIQLTLSRSIALNRRHEGEDHGSMSIMPVKEDISPSGNSNENAVVPHETKFSSDPIVNLHEDKYEMYTNSNGIYKCKAEYPEDTKDSNNRQQNQSQQQSQQQSQKNSGEAQNNQQQNQDHQQSQQNQQQSQQNNGQTQNNQNTPHPEHYDGHQMDNQPQNKDIYTSTKTPTPLPEKKTSLLSGIPVIGNIASSLGIDSLLGGIY